MSLACKVGSFAKRAGTGSQAITGVGFQGKALLLWTAGQVTADTFGLSAWLAFGMSGKAAAGTITSACLSGTSQDNQANGNASRRSSSKAISIVQWAETVIAEADLTSFDADGFTLNWTTNEASTARIIHYMVLGGSDLTAAKAIYFGRKGATGSQSETGVGFQPDFGFFAHLGNVSGFDPPVTQTSQVFGLGASDGTNSWLLTDTAVDSVSIMDTNRGHRTGNVLGSVSGATFTWENLASLTSFDADGFTLSWSAAVAGNARQLALLLQGGDYKVGTIAKSTGSAPATQAVTGAGFAPSGVLLSSVFAAGLTGGNGTDHGRLGIGASDGTNQHAIASSDTDALLDSSVDAIDSTTKTFIKVDNNTATQDAAATAALDSDGFTLTWTPNDAVATDVSYVLFGPAAAPTATPRSSIVITA